MRFISRFTSLPLLMWISLAVFATRVCGQVEVLLLSPGWLPPFNAWESGLVPYGILLPLQIALIAAMSIVAVDHSRAAGFLRVTKPATRRALRRFAFIYFLVMLLRLIVTAAIPPHSVWERGLIPIIAHWDLAGFILLASATPAAAPSAGDEC